MHGATFEQQQQQKMFEISFIHVPGKYDTVKNSCPAVKIKKNKTHEQRC